MEAELFGKFISATALLFFVLDPVGNVPTFVSLLQRVEPSRRLFVVTRECAIAFCLLVLFMLFGRSFLNLLRLSEQALSIAGGIVLFLIALKMIFPVRKGVFEDEPEGEPYIVPLAIPLIAGPSAMATSLLMVSREPAHLWLWIAALSCAMGITALILISAGPIQRLVGVRTVAAVERLIGLILTAMAVEMLLDGIQTFLQSIH